MLGDVTDTADYAAWIGRSERRDDLLTQSIVNRFNATLDRDDLATADGDVAPPLIHWLLFLPHERQSGLGPDGHAARGGFLPPVNRLPRRMWAGGRFIFGAPIRVGMALSRTSTIADVKLRAGDTGELIFVTVRHKLTDADGAPLLTEEHDIVYRSAATVAVKPPKEFPPQGAWHRSFVPDATLLFRYSALTFNGHRIHYDRNYVTQEEGYPGLIVHGPLIATLLLDLTRRYLPQVKLRSFQFRALSPMFDGNVLNLNGTPPDDEGKIALWATNAEGGLTMRAEAVVA